MKTLYFSAAAAVLFAMLISCAGSPAGEVSAAPDTDAVELSSPEEEAVQVETVWKPLTIVYMYIDGTVDKTISYTYDDEGRELVSEEYDGQGELQNSSRLLYTGGNLQRREVFDGANLTGITLYEADENGNIISIIKQDTEGNTLSIVENTYEKSLLKTSTAFDASGIPSLKSVFTYQNGELTGVEYQLPDGSPDASLERIFENGLPVREQVVLPDGSVETARDFAYTSGLLTGETQYAGKTKIKTAVYEYDDDKNLMREIWSDRSGNEYEVIEYSWISFEISE